jgi:hypothetical protein
MGQLKYHLLVYLIIMLLLLMMRLGKLGFIAFEKNMMYLILVRDLTSLTPHVGRIICFLCNKGRH